MTLGRETRPGRAMKAFDIEVAIVESRDEMRRRAARLPAADVSIVDDDHRPPLACEQVRGCQSRDARADDAHIRLRLAR